MKNKMNSLLPSHDIQKHLSQTLHSEFEGIKVNEQFFTKMDLKYESGPVEPGDPNKNSKSYEPAVSFLPTYWAGYY
ncbi:MAG: hypothetical protein KBD90_06680 [Alphaproteobacteria bacterium]|nr:hypothetical protein [Alphaproteobacteria bacterium]